MTATIAGTPEPAVQRSPPRAAAGGDRLPPQARAKLIALRGASVDARDAAQSAQVRYADLKQLDYTTMAPEKAGGIETEMSRLLAVRGQQNHRHSELTALVATIEHWLQTLPPSTMLEPAKPVTVKPHKDETLSQAIARTRDEVAALRQHLQAVRRAPLPKADLRKEAARFVADLAQQGRPRVTASGGTFSVVFHDQNAYAPSGIRGVAQLLAWLDPDKLVKKLQAEVDLLPEPTLALSAKEKEKRLGELRADLEAAERTEEALVEKAIGDGLDILRRTAASPLAVLGVKFKNKIERVRTQ